MLHNAAETILKNSSNFSKIDFDARNLYWKSERNGNIVTYTFKDESYLTINYDDSTITMPVGN